MAIHSNSCDSFVSKLLGLDRMIKKSNIILVIIALLITIFFGCSEDAKLIEPEPEPEPEPPTYTLTLNVLGRGTVKANPNKTRYDEGETLLTTLELQLNISALYRP